MLSTGLLLLLFLLLDKLGQAEGLQPKIRYNLGQNTSYMDDEGKGWEADPFNSSGVSIDACPLPYGFRNPELYCNYRAWNMTSGVLDIAVSQTGYYDTILYFYGDSGDEPGPQIVNIYLENEKIYNDLEIRDNTIFSLRLRGYVDDGAISIEIKGKVGVPVLSAIEVDPTPGAHSTPPISITTDATPSTANSNRVNLGADADYVDSNGTVWAADTFTTGFEVDTCESLFDGWTDSQLYCRYRQWTSSTSGVIEVPVPDADIYSTILYFSETQVGVGKRVVDVYYEDNLVLEGLDVAYRIGGSYGVFRFTITGPISDGASSIEIRSQIGDPVLAAIAVVKSNADASTQSSIHAETAAPSASQIAAPTLITRAPTTATSSTPTKAPIIAPPLSANRISLGSTKDYTDSTGNIWSADVFETGAEVDKCSSLFNGEMESELYCRYREWVLPTSGLLEVPVPDSDYYSTVLIFSETEAEAGERVVDIYYEGNLVLERLDVAERIDGSYGVFRLTITGLINDGASSIEIRSQIGNPVLAAIEVVKSVSKGTAIAVQANNYND